MPSKIQQNVNKHTKETKKLSNNVHMGHHRRLDPVCRHPRVLVLAEVATTELVIAKTTADINCCC